MEGFPLDDLRKILHGGQRMARVQNGVNHCQKIQRAEYGIRTLQTTDGFAMANKRT